MKVYHGSSVLVKTPDIFHWRENAEFGKGFYVTPIFEQALWWSGKFDNPQMAEYEFNLEEAEKLKVLKFKEYGPEMREFTECCMTGRDESDYDIVSGPFFTEETISGRKFEGPMLQICFRTEKAIAACLNFEKAIDILDFSNKNT